MENPKSIKLTQDNGLKLLKMRPSNAEGRQNMVPRSRASLRYLRWRMTSGLRRALG